MIVFLDTNILLRIFTDTPLPGWIKPVLEEAECLVVSELSLIETNERGLRDFLEKAPIKVERARNQEMLLAKFKKSNVGDAIVAHAYQLNASFVTDSQKRAHLASQLGIRYYSLGSP